MSIPHRSDLVERLARELKLPAQQAEMMADRIERLPPDLQQAFRHWWDTGELPEVEVEGYTAPQLVAEHGFTPVAALFTLDWLKREPDAARASLARGHDRIVR